MGKVTSIKYKQTPLVQGGLEIPVEVTVDWDDERALEILKRRTEEVSYSPKKTEEYQEQSKDILNLILPSEDILSDSDSEEPGEESWDFDFCNEIKVF